MAKKQNIKKSLSDTYESLVFGTILIGFFEVAFIIAFVLFYINNWFNFKQILIDTDLAIFVAVLSFVCVINLIFINIVLFTVMGMRSKSDLKTAKLLGSGVDEAYNFGRIGLIVVEKVKDKSIVIWANTLMMNRYSRSPSVLINQDILDIFPDIQFDPNEEMIVKQSNYTYRVKYLLDSGLFIFEDITDFNDLNKKYKDDAMCIGLVRIDNFQTDSRLRANIALMSDIRHMIAEYFDNFDTYLNSISDDSFFFVCDNKSLNKIISDQFSLLDKVKDIDTDGGGSITLSIGVAYGIPSIPRLKILCNDALKEALNRGGDQAVVSQFGQNNVFIGGKTLAKSIQNNATTRDNANKILKFIQDSDQVLIMGHKNADLDAFGSALGILMMCSYKGKPAKVIFDKNSSANEVRSLVLNDIGMNNPILINSKDALKLANEKSNTLVIVTDCSSRETVLCEDLLDIYQIKVLIIDHHQPGANAKRIENPIGAFIFPALSSASEIVANFIKFATANPRIPINPKFATVMLSGILLDTDSYRRDTTSPSTYEASMFLKECGADNQLAAKLVVGTKEEFVMLSKYLSNMTMIVPSVAYVAVDEGENTLINDVIMAKIADSFIRVRDIRASFAIGRVMGFNGKPIIKASARSDGTINVAKLMQYLGGGGRFNAAACTWKDDSLKDAERSLVKVVTEHIDDCMYIKEDNE